MLKRTILALCALLAVLLGSSGVAGAQVNAPAVENCKHASGNGTIVSAAYVVDWQEHRVGAVQLCKDSSNHYWGYLVFYSPLVAGEWGNVYLVRYHDGVKLAEYDCDTYPGNGRVRPTETMCWTPKIAGGDYRYTWQAIAIKHVGSTRVAFGKTALTR